MSSETTARTVGDAGTPTRGRPTVLRRPGARRRAACTLALALLAGVTAACSSATSASSTTSTTASSTSTSAAGAGATSAPGVTAKTVTVGSISDISLPIPGLFLGAKIGTEAYFAYINSQGGVNGRKLVLDARDSAFSSGTVANEAKSIAQSDLAMVGGFSLLDQAEKPVIDANQLPDVAQVLSEELQPDKNVYAPEPIVPNGGGDGAQKWLAQTYPSQVKATAVIGSNSAASAVYAEHVAKNITESVGWKWIYSRDASYTESTFLPDVVKMKSLGVKVLYEVPQQAPYIATMVQEMRQQGLDALLIGGSNIYAKNFAPGTAGNGSIFYGATALYMGEDAKVVPAVATFDKWVKKIDPATNLDLYTFYGWISGMLFAQALKAAGQDPTRASLRAALNNITSFDANGLIPTANPAKGIPGQCWLVAKYENGTWHRYGPDPKTGFVCKPSGIYPSNYKGISR